jgi:acyl carrier protein
MKPIPEILAEIRPEYNFASSSDFIADGMLDSFDIVTLVAALDHHFSISIRGTDIVPENFKNTGAICEMLKTYGVCS